jgi:hypothetical protein
MLIVLVGGKPIVTYMTIEYNFQLSLLDSATAAMTVKKKQDS